MKRVAALIVVVLLFGAAPVNAQAPRAQEASRALEAEARASVLAATIDVQPAFDPALVDSRSTSSTVGASSLQSIIWPSFLLDAFMFLYGFQSVERVGLGIAEARWPQGPQSVDATQSDLLFLNGGDPDAVPGKGGVARAAASDGSASGHASAAETTLPGGIVIGKARSSSSVRTANDVSDAGARETLHDIVAGPLAVRTIEGTAGAHASASDATATQRLIVAGATVNGTPVTVDDEGVHAQTAALQRQVDEALRAAGVTVALLPGARNEKPGHATASTGGLLVNVRARATDPSGTPRNVTIGYLLGAASAGARSESLGARPSRVLGDTVDRGTRTIVERFVIPATRESRDVAAPSYRRRIIVTAAATGPGVGARGAYLAVMLAAFGLLLTRRLVRAAARP